MFLFLSFFVVYTYSSTCTFQNYNFTDSLGVGWIIDQTNPTPYIDGNHYLILGDLTTETTGNSSVYQDFTISSCNQNLTINFAAYTKDNSVLHDQQYVLIKNPSNGDILATIFKTLLGFNLSYGEIWYQINCNVCSGTCGNVDLTTLGVSPLRLELMVYQNGNINGMGHTTPTALIIKDVCLE